MALSAIAVIVVIAISLVSYSGGYAQEAQLYRPVAQAPLSRVRVSSSASSEIGNLTQEKTLLMYELNETQTSYNALLGNYTIKSYVYIPQGVNATFQIWGIPQTMGPKSSEAWDLLDTFINHININTTSPSRFYIFDLDDFALWYTHKFSIPLVNQTGTNFSYEFEPSVGCAVYVLVIQNLENSSNTIIPHVTATYAPSLFLTGVCAG